MPRRGIASFFSSSSSWHHRKTTLHAPLSPSRHTFSDVVMEENIVAAEEVLSKWGTDVEASLFSAGGRPDPGRFLRSVVDLHHSMLFLSSPSAESAASPADRSAALLHAHSLLSAAMSRLGREMHLLLSANHYLLNPQDSLRPVAASSSSSSLDEVSISEDTAGDGFAEAESAADVVARDVRAVADAMVSAGYGKECVRIYKTMRKSFVHESTYRMGFDRLTQSQVQKLDWPALDSKIRSWLAVVPVAFGSIFSGERHLCDHVFAGSEAIQESCFADIALDAAFRLLAFPDLVARSKRSPEKLFRILDLYDAIAELLPDIESTFAFESTAAVRSQAVASLLRLAEVARSTLADFEAAMMRDTSRTPVPGGDVHPLTRYVMNYLGFLADYELALADIFADFPLENPNAFPESFEVASLATTPASPPSPSSVSSSTSFEGSPWNFSPATAASAAGSISSRIAWLVLVLICKLDSKAQLHCEVALSYLFLANNIQYIVRKVNDSRLRFLLGDGWVTRHRDKARHYAASYERLGWSKVAAMIPAEPSQLEAAEAEERMQGFNEALEAACKEQAGWVVVADGGLREDVREAVAEMVVPEYRAFYKRYQGTLRGSDPAAAAAVRFSPEDVANQIRSLFVRSAVCLSSASSSSSRDPDDIISSVTTSSSRHINNYEITRHHFSDELNT